MKNRKYRAWDETNKTMSYSVQYPTLSSFFQYVEMTKAVVMEGVSQEPPFMYEEDVIRATLKDSLREFGVDVCAKFHIQDDGDMGYTLIGISPRDIEGSGFELESCSAIKWTVLGNGFENHELWSDW